MLFGNQKLNMRGFDSITRRQDLKLGSNLVFGFEHGQSGMSFLIIMICLALQHGR